MRWILVFLFLYLIPLTVLFKNYKNFKRSCIYGCTYVVMATTIVITNVYISGLNKIKESMYYQNYAIDSRYHDKYDSNFNSKNQDVNNNKENNNMENDKETSNIVDEDKNKQDKDNTKPNKDSIVKENVTNQGLDYESAENNIDYSDSLYSDTDSVFNFKKDIYSIERQALMPMRDCMPYTKNISKNIKKLGKIRKDIVYARDMCKDVVNEYEDMEIKELSKSEYTEVLYSARDDVKKAYELREKAMDSAIKLVDTKSPKYIGQVTKYLELSDKQIESFKERIEHLNTKIESNLNN